jgi:hypothetical protein
MTVKSKPKTRRERFGKVIVNIHFRDWPEWPSKD